MCQTGIVRSLVWITWKPWIFQACKQLLKLLLTVMIKANLISITAVHVYEFKLPTSNYKINNHGKNEIRHDHLKFISVKEISYMVKTKKHSQPKQVINFASKTSYCQGQKPSSGQQFLVKDHPSMWCITAQCVHNVDFWVFFCFPVTVFYKRGSEWQACTDSLWSFADHLAWKP